MYEELRMNTFYQFGNRKIDNAINYPLSVWIPGIVNSSPDLACSLVRIKHQEQRENRPSGEIDTKTIKIITQVKRQNKIFIKTWELYFKITERNMVGVYARPNMAVQKKKTIWVFVEKNWKTLNMYIFFIPVLIGKYDGYTYFKSFYLCYDKIFYK